jgi:hypothetical protein
MALKAKIAHSGPWTLGLRRLSTGAVIGGQAKLRVGSSSALCRFKPGQHVFGTGLIPAPGFIHTPFLFGLGAGPGACKHAPYALGSPAHEISYFTIRPHGFPAQSFRGSDPFSLEHGAEIQKLKKYLAYNPDRPQADIISVFIELARLFDLHQPGSLEIGNGSFATALAHAGRGHKAFHVHVHKTVIQGGSSQAQGSQVQKGKHGFENNLIGFSPLGTDLPFAPVQGMTFLWMAIPCFCPLRRKRKNTRQTAPALADGPGWTKAGLHGIMPAAIPRHSLIVLAGNF